MMQEVYQKRIESLSVNAKDLKARDKTYSILRLVFFIAAVGIAIFLVSISWIYAIAWIIIALVAFSRLLRYHDTIIRDRKLTNIQISLNENELKSLDNDHSYFYDGVRFQDDLHPYTTDMDVFGDHSIFQMLNRATTVFGENRLAEVLSNNLESKQITEYQNAAQELEEKLEWRQWLYSLGKLGIDEEHDFSKIERWIKSESPLKIKSTFIYLAVAFCWLLFAAMLFKGIPLGMALLAFLPNVLIAYRNNKSITKVHSFLDKNEKFFRPYAEIVSYLEESQFESSLLKRLQSIFKLGNKNASYQLTLLAKYLKQLDIRTNFFGFLFTYGFLWDHIYALKVENWKSENKESLFKWFDSIGQFEYISSISNFAFQHPEYCYPSINQEKLLDGDNLGHPLLHSKQRISNNFTMPTHKHIKIVTGSNMGGKSTFLRTLGVNLLLAYAGTKVCATKLDLPILRLMSSMRTQDALKENTSSFYAELKRLKMVIDSVKEYDNVFFLLDEILKGTNSNDRHNGARAMIKQMISNDGAGLVSTHDLELGKLEDELPQEIDNICFEVEVDKEELVFDYKIKDGISKSFNATHLMRNIGIDI